jgi:hypothetical protein
MNHHLSAETKHHILLEYSPYTYDHSFKALAIRHNIQGGRQVIEKWYAQWDRTPESLMEHNRSGRKRKLNTAQINELIAQPIIKAHSSATPIHYPKLMPSIRRSISEPISIQTIRRYGKKDLQFSNKTCIPRTKKKVSIHILLLNAQCLSFTHVMTCNFFYFCSVSEGQIQCVMR